MQDEIERDIKRAQKAREAAERNFKEGDILTAANRSFVTCENAVYVLLKLRFGSSSVSRMKILTRLKEINPKIKETYDNSYDLRVQADYGRKARVVPLNKENMEKSLRDVNEVLEEAEKIKGKKEDTKKEKDRGEKD